MIHMSVKIQQAQVPMNLRLWMCADACIRTIGRGDYSMKK